MERENDNYTTKNTQKSTHETYQEEHILEGEGLPLGVLGVCGGDGTVVEGVAPPRRENGEYTGVRLTSSASI